MKSNLRSRLHIVNLEDRCTPALVVGYDAQHDLAITAAAGAQSDGLTVLVNSGNSVTILEGAQVYGTYKLSHDLRIDLGDNTVGFLNRLDLNNNKLAANVSVRLGNSTPGKVDQFRTTTPLGGAGTLNGNLKIRAGDGSQSVRFGEQGDQSAVRTINITGSIDINMGAGGDLNSGPPDLVVTGGNNANNAQLNVGGDVLIMNATVAGIRGTVGGSLNIDSRTKPTPTQVFLSNFGLPLQVNGSLVVEMGNGDDLIQFQDSTVSGFAAVNSRGGTDEIDFGLSDSDGDNPATFMGNLAVRGGAGNHLVNFGAQNADVGEPTIPFFLKGNLDVTLDNGNDSVNFIDAATTGRFITLQTGLGNDILSISKLVSSKALFFGLLGNGNDAFTFADNATVQLGFAFVDGGSGDDVLTLGADNNFSFPMIAVGF
jgi:hypothetical protein